MTTRPHPDERHADGPSLPWRLGRLIGGLTLAFLLLVGWLQWRSLKASVQEEVVAAHRVAVQLLTRTSVMPIGQGVPQMLAFLQGTGRVRATDLRLVDGGGRELYRSPEPVYKAGRAAPAWFEHAITPEIPLQVIDFPDGQLEVRPNAGRAAVDAWDEMRRLALIGLGWLAVLALVLGWAVGRAVRPFGTIVDALARLEAGSLEQRLPPLPGREAGAIASAFNRMAARLQAQWETERRAVAAEARLHESRELARAMDARIEDERRRIAQELHDELGQTVTGVRALALGIAARVEGADALSAASARRIADEAGRLYDAMHGVIPRLAPLVLDRFGLGEALQELAQRTEASHPGVVVSCAVAVDGAQAVDAERALALYRSAQEGITNALRHGHAHRLELRLEASDADGGLRLTLRDDGLGVDQVPPDPRRAHHGLRWLRERAEGLGGQLRLQPAPGGRGSVLEVTLPAAPVAPSAAPAA